MYSDMKETTNALMQGQNMGTLTPKSSIVPLISEKHVSPFQTVKEKLVHVFSFEAKHLPNKALGEFCSFLNCQDKQFLLEITESSVSFIGPLSEILPEALTCLNCQYLLN